MNALVKASRLTADKVFRETEKDSHIKAKVVFLTFIEENGWIETVLRGVKKALLISFNSISLSSTLQMWFNMLLLFSFLCSDDCGESFSVLV